jgi:hypothetical protein
MWNKSGIFDQVVEVGDEGQRFVYIKMALFLKRLWAFAWKDSSRGRVGL